jgi:hypothetical protein
VSSLSWVSRARNASTARDQLLVPSPVTISLTNLAVFAVELCPQLGSPLVIGLLPGADGLHRHWGVCAEADAHALTLCKAGATFPSCTRRCRCITRCARPGSRFSRVRRRAKHLPPGGVHVHSRTVAISSVARRAGVPPDVTKSAPSVAPGMVGIRKVVNTNSGGAGPDRIQRPAA